VKHALRSSILSFARLTKDLRVRGRRNIPATGPAIFVSLHRTDADPILVSAAVRREVLWVYASFLDQVPVLGRLLRRYGFVAAAYREITGIRSVREMVAALTAGKALGIFPEGATPLMDPHGGDGHRFSPSFARLAILTGSPVIPVVIAARRVVTRPYPLPRPFRRNMGLPTAAAEVRFRRVISGVTVHFDRPRTLDPTRSYREQAQAVHRRLLELRDRTTAQASTTQELL
jgi:1-acyl-sn-glycerol-3-phosphate acyltransferase